MENQEDQSVSEDNFLQILSMCHLISLEEEEDTTYAKELFKMIED